MYNNLLLQALSNPHTIALAALFVGVLFFWTVFCGKLFKIFFHIPIVAGQIIAGIILGPSYINIAQSFLFTHQLHLAIPDSNALFVLPLADIFVGLILLLSSVLTVPLLLWIAGHETDVREMMQVGLSALLAGVFGALFPIVFVIFVLQSFFCSSYTMIQSTGLGLAFAATSVSIPIAMLFAHNKMHLKSSKATLGAAVVDDIVAVMLLSFFMMLFESGFFTTGTASISFVTLLYSFGYMLFVLGLLCILGYLIIPRITRTLYRYNFTHLLPAFALCSMFFTYAFVELVGGLSGITGAYFMGIFHAIEDKEHKAKNVIEPFVNSFLLPLFLGSIGFQVNMKLLSLYDWMMVVLLLLIAVLTKFLGCFVAAKVANLFAPKESLWTNIQICLFGAAMVSRGEVGLVIATALYGVHIFTQPQFVIAIVVIILTTITTPILLEAGFSYETRSVS